MTIFTASFHHLLENNTPLGPELAIDGVRYVTVPARPYAGNSLDRLLNIFDFTKNLYAVGRRHGDGLSPPDAVIASSPHPFVVFPGQKLAQRYKAKFVYEVRDIWPLSVTEIQGTSRLHPFVMLCAAAERFALTKTDLVASVLPRLDRYLRERGYGHKPLVWVPNGINLLDHDDPQADPVTEPARTAAAKLAEWRAEKKVGIVYTGAIGRPNAIDQLMQALLHGKATGATDRYGMLIVGKGEQLDALRTLARDNDLSNVHFSGAVPKRDAIALLSRADIGYAGLRDIASLFRYGISPNKIVDYFSASLPVFLPLEPCGDPVSESGGGIARKASTPEAVWSGLNELIQMSPEQRSSLGAKGKAYMMREYDYAEIARRYADAISHRHT